MTKTKPDMSDLLQIMRHLRDPDTGCPWDKEQTFESIAPYTIEESYEVAEAIAHKDMDELKDELGDLLFQVVFHAQMAAEQGAFDFDDVVAAVCDKMWRRHPHVFGNASVKDAAAQTHAWEEHKKQERVEKAAKRGQAPSVLDGVAQSLPGLLRAQKLSNRAAKAGFDWDTFHQVLDKVREEEAELAHEVMLLDAGEGDPMALTHEFGDILFAWVNAARFIGVDAEDAMRAVNRRFEARFRKLEELAAAEGKNLEDMDVPQLETIWQRAKTALAQGG